MNSLAPQTWHGCYESGWKGVITPDSFAHPAKFSRALIERIFNHCLARGYLKKGQTVGDCFGGIGTGGIMASYAGLSWIGCELEPRFHKMAEDNFALHQAAWTTMKLPWPRIIQGDSRHFDALLGEDYDAMVSSPPFSERQPTSDARPGQTTQLKEMSVDTYGETSGQIGQLKSGSVDSVISSPPYSEIAAGAGGLNTKPAKHAGQQSGRQASAASQDTDQHYGTVPGQISRLKSGSVEAVVSSPPYISGGHHPDQTGAWNTNGLGQSKGRGLGSKEAANYGKTEGQIGALNPGDVDAVVTSPPWEENNAGGVGAHKLKDPDKFATEMSRLQRGHSASPEARRKQFAKAAEQVYGESKGQIGNESGETYWQAMDAVYRACHRAIKPGGIIALVVKDYVKDKQRVPLCDDTARLLEHIGFTVIERIHAMLVQETVHNDLFAGSTTTKKERKSFFRRLAEKKGSPKIDYEVVLIARRP